MVIVIVEGAGQDLLTECMCTMDQQDVSGNNLPQDVDLWLSLKIKDPFSKRQKMAIKLKYIDPTYMILAIPSNASDNVLMCTAFSWLTVPFMLIWLGTLASQLALLMGNMPTYQFISLGADL